MHSAVHAEGGWLDRMQGTERPFRFLNRPLDMHALSLSRHHRNSCIACGKGSKVFNEVKYWYVKNLQTEAASSPTRCRQRVKNTVAALKVILNLPTVMSLI